MSSDIHGSVVARLRAVGCVFADDEARLLASAAGSTAELDALVDRRVSGVPIEHVIGWAEFYGLRVDVAPGVFVPRRRTEFLVDVAASLGRRGAVVLDLCCGSGAIGGAVASQLQSAELHAVDVDPVAVDCARRNLERFGGQVYRGDLFDPLPDDLRGRVDILTANVPYVPSDEIGLLPPEARDYEPRSALDGGSDGLDLLRRVAEAAPEWLAPGGSLLTELSERQAPTAVDLLTRAGLTAHVETSDDTTVVIATAGGPPATG